MANEEQQRAHQPSDVAMMRQLLQSMGVEDYEPRVINQLLDFMYKYTTDVLLDAESYGVHAGRPMGSADVEDVMLAVQVRALAAASSSMQAGKLPATLAGPRCPVGVRLPACSGPQNSVESSTGAC